MEVSRHQDIFLYFGVYTLPTGARRCLLYYMKIPERKETPDVAVSLAGPLVKLDDIFSMIAQARIQLLAKGEVVKIMELQILLPQ